MEYQVQENCLTIYLPAEVDHHNAEEMKRKADKLIDRNHIKYVIFDFENTDFMIVPVSELLWGDIKRFL